MAKHHFTNPPTNLPKQPRHHSPHRRLVLPRRIHTATDTKLNWIPLHLPAAILTAIPSNMARLNRHDVFDVQGPKRQCDVETNLHRSRLRHDRHGHSGSCKCHRNINSASTLLS